MKTLLNAIKGILPDRPVPLRILRGPFRGATICMNPRNSLRKVFGFYEHELNAWLESALLSVHRIIDVGANDGYFSFGCAAAFRRLKRPGEIVAIESQDQHICELRQSIGAQIIKEVRYSIIQGYAGSEDGGSVMTLDSIQCGFGDPGDRSKTLIKIDVEGGEIDVVAGAASWIQPSNYFVIEVHHYATLALLKSMFEKKGHRLVQIEQRPLPLLGRELRMETNWWLVSELKS